MTEAVAAYVAPGMLPTPFEQAAGPVVRDTWHDGLSDVSSNTFGNGFPERWPSSSRQGTLENLLRLRLRLPSTTVSQTDIAELLTDLYLAGKHAATVKEANASENVFELRRLTGLTWERLADILNVDRRTLHNWVKGGKIRETNRRHIAETLSVLRFADRGSAEENAAALAERSSAHEEPVESIKAGRYSDARQYLSRGRSRPRPALRESFWVSGTGEFQPMLTHQDADGSETIRPLPYEPKPASRKRRIKRG